MRRWLVVAGVVAGCSREGARSRLPGPVPVRVGDPVAENARCVECHSDIAAEWRGSEHQTSFSDPVFQRALAIEPSPFCVGCHSPEGPTGRDAERAAIGVACVTCHLAGEVVAAAPRAGAVEAPHRVERRADLATSAACASCHEFSFGDDPRRASPLGMQRTVSEHAASPLADKSCADCHMPVVDGPRGRHRSHTFAETRDPAWLRRALVASAVRVGDGEVQVSLSLRDVGHAFPTGDLFRRLSVTADAVGDDQRSLASATRYLGRHFGVGSALDLRPIRVELADDRPGAHGPQPTMTVALALGPRATGAPVVWRVALERVLHVSDGRESSATIASEVELARGTLP